MRLALNVCIRLYLIPALRWKIYVFVKYIFHFLYRQTINALSKLLWNFISTFSNWHKWFKIYHIFSKYLNNKFISVQNCPPEFDHDNLVISYHVFYAYQLTVQTPIRLLRLSSLIMVCTVSPGILSNIYCKHYSLNLTSNLFLYNKPTDTNCLT